MCTERTTPQSRHPSELEAVRCVGFRQEPNKGRANNADRQRAVWRHGAGHLVEQALVEDAERMLGPHRLNTAGSLSDSDGYDPDVGSNLRKFGLGPCSAGTVVRAGSRPSKTSAPKFPLWASAARVGVRCSLNRGDPGQRTCVSRCG
jgi:hypothetical protein